MAMSISTQSPNGTNQVPAGQVQVNLSVTVLKAQKSAAVGGLLEVAEQFEAPEPDAAEEE